MGPFLSESDILKLITLNSSVWTLCLCLNFYLFDAVFSLKPFFSSYAENKKNYFQVFKMFSMKSS